MTKLSSLRAHWGAWLVAGCAAFGSLGCGSDAANPPSASKTETEPTYALMTQVFSADFEDRTTYIAMTHTLDPKSIALDDAREYPGVANFNTVAGRVLISSGSEPTITEFNVSDDFTWKEGRSVGFNRYPLEDNANWFSQFVLGEEVSYLPYERSKRVIWNPKEMTIEGEREDSSLEFELNGLILEPGGNRNGVRYPDQVHQAFFYHDEDWFRIGDESLIVTYDPKTHEEQKVTRVPCPGLSIATQDEQGYTYFSTWDYRPGFALYGEGPAPCVARVDAKGDLDTAFTTDFTELTGGKFSVNFRYVGKGLAVANVYDAEQAGVNFSGPLDVEVLAGQWESSPAWQIWIFDLDRKEAHPVEGIDLSLSSGAQFSVVDGRTFLFLPYDDYKRSKIYEIDADGKATEHLDVAGDVLKWLRVR